MTPSAILPTAKASRLPPWRGSWRRYRYETARAVLVTVLCSAVGLGGTLLVVTLAA